jgi:hypothetical protein
MRVRRTNALHSHHLSRPRYQLCFRHSQTPTRNNVAWPKCIQSSRQVFQRRHSLKAKIWFEVNSSLSFFVIFMVGTYKYKRTALLAWFCRVNKPHCVMHVRRRSLCRQNQFRRRLDASQVGYECLLLSIWVLEIKIKMKSFL